MLTDVVIRICVFILQMRIFIFARGICELQFEDIIEVDFLETCFTNHTPNSLLLPKGGCLNITTSSSSPIRSHYFCQMEVLVEYECVYYYRLFPLNIMKHTTQLNVETRETDAVKWDLVGTYGMSSSGYDVQATGFGRHLKITLHTSSPAPYILGYDTFNLLLWCTKPPKQSSYQVTGTTLAIVITIVVCAVFTMVTYIKVHRYTKAQDVQIERLRQIQMERDERLTHTHSDIIMGHDPQLDHSTKVIKMDRSYAQMDRLTNRKVGKAGVKMGQDKNCKEGRANSKIKHDKDGKVGRVNSKMKSNKVGRTNSKLKSNRFRKLGQANSKINQDRDHKVGKVVGKIDEDNIDEDNIDYNLDKTHAKMERDKVDQIGVKGDKGRESNLEKVDGKMKQDKGSNLNKVDAKIDHDSRIKATQSDDKIQQDDLSNANIYDDVHITQVDIKMSQDGKTTSDQEDKIEQDSNVKC